MKRSEPVNGWHTSVGYAIGDGWVNPYVGNKGRIYGKKPGNHRIFRCYWQQPK